MTHTKESLEALGPRELDALAAAVVLGHEITWITSPFSGRVFPFDRTEQLELPEYGTSLDAAAQLEAELAERELHDAYLLALTATVHPEYILYSGMTVKQRFEKVTATAKARTIAAILAVQEAA